MNYNQIKYLFGLWLGILCMKTLYGFLQEDIREYFVIKFLTSTDFLSGNLGCFIVGYYLHRNKKVYSNKLLDISILIITGIISIGHIGKQ